MSAPLESPLPKAKAIPWEIPASAELLMLELAEAVRPPAFPKAAEREKGRVVGFTAWLTPGHPSEPGPCVTRPRSTRAMRGTST